MPETRRTPKLHWIRGSATACGIALGGRINDHFQHPRLPSTARSYRSDRKVVYASPVVDDVFCAQCKGVWRRELAANG